MKSQWQIDLEKQYEEVFKQPPPKSLMSGRHWPDPPILLLKQAINSGVPIEEIPDEPGIIR